MSKLLRYHRGTDVCFVTSVTNNRRKILVEHPDLLLAALGKYSEQLQFRLTAYVILPDHFHGLIECGGNDISKIMKLVKLSFSKSYRNRLGVRVGHVWQSRFWDHIIRDQDDMNRHIDYIHYNPVKHGLVESPLGWKLSTIQQYLRDGYYSSEWGNRPMELVGEYGDS